MKDKFTPILFTIIMFSMWCFPIVFPTLAPYAILLGFAEALLVIILIKVYKKYKGTNHE